MIFFKKSKKQPLLSQIIDKFDYILVFFTVFFVYLLTTYPSVPAEDAGELIVSALATDIAHPPGYPAYVLIGKLFSMLMPFGSPAWRINIMSGFFGATSSALLYLLLKKSIKNDLIAFAASLFFAFGNIVWSQSNRAEVYTLNTFFLSLVIYLLYNWSVSGKNKWLYASAITYGLSLGNHHMMFLAGPAIIAFVLLKEWRLMLKPKVIACCTLLLLAGLSVYLYLPLRSYIAPYDNPAYIEHTGLYNWDSFFSFVNRKIYGGTLASGEQSSLSFIQNYWKMFIENNKIGFFALMRTIIKEYFYIPLLFILPGIYHILKKNWRFGVFIIGLFASYTALLLIFIPVESNADTFSYSSEHPFFIAAIFIAAIFIGNGFAWLKSVITDKKTGAFLTILFFILPLISIKQNFAKNNESKNYVAYDFNRNLLESMPLNGYLISTGRDNMTFPLYYLRKIENMRKDVHLEIYYGDSPINENYLKNKLVETGEKSIFIDLPQLSYNKMNLKPYNYVYQYGENPNLPNPKNEGFTLRGTRQNMNFPDNSLKGYHYIKLALLNQHDAQKRKYYFDKVINELSENSDHLNFIKEFEEKSKSLSEKSLSLRNFQTGSSSMIPKQ